MRSRVIIGRIRDSASTSRGARLHLRRWLKHVADVFEVLESVLQTVTLCVLVVQLLQELGDLYLGLLLFVGDLVDVGDLLLQPLLQVKLHEDGIFLQVQKVANVLLHRLVLFFELHDAGETVHEEVH